MEESIELPTGGHKVLVGQGEARTWDIQRLPEGSWWAERFGKYEPGVEKDWMVCEKHLWDTGGWTT